MYINKNNEQNLIHPSGYSSHRPETENKKNTFRNSLKKVMNSLASIDENYFSTPLKVKRHKLFRGITCWLSYYYKDKHAVKFSDSLQRAKTIMANLQDNPGSAAVLSFGKSAHNLIVINNGHNRYCIASTEYIYTGEGDKFFNEIRLSLATTINKWQDEIKGKNVVYLKGLNNENIFDYIEKNLNDKKFDYHYLSKNCSRYVADIMLAGYDGDKSKLRHNRKWQMPANTLELAKELHNKLIK